MPSGSVLSKTEAAVVVQLQLPTAANQLLPTHVRIPKHTFSQARPLLQKARHNLDAFGESEGLLQSQVVPPLADAEASLQGVEMWRRIQPGDAIKVTVLGVQQEHKQQESSAGFRRPAGNSSSIPPPPPLTSLLRLIVQPVLDDSRASVDLPQEAVAAAEVAAQASQDSDSGKSGLLERL